MYKNYELKNTFYHFTKKYSTGAVLFFERFRSVSLSRNKKKKKKIENQPMEKAKKL